MCGSDAPTTTTHDANPIKIDRTILSRLVDVHCHPTDSRSYNLATLKIDDISMKQIVSLFSSLKLIEKY